MTYIFLIVFWPGRDYVIGNYNFYKNRKHIHDVYMKAESFVYMYIFFMLRMEIELFSKLLELFCIFCLCFFDLCLPCFLVFLQLKSSLILFRSENYLILIRLQHMRPAIARARLCTRLKHWRRAKKSTPCLIKKASRCAADRTSKTTKFLIFHFL